MLPYFTPINKFLYVNDWWCGIFKTKLIKELTYIYLAICWKSPYNNYTEQERHEEALSDSGLTEKEFNDPVFREACKKFRAL